MRIVKYRPEYQKDFQRLNKAWVEKYFEIEPMDEALLSNPEDNILKKGGRIYFAAFQNQIIGTVALIFITTGVYELAKMAVSEKFQGMGAGKLLCKTAIDEAKKLNADKLILFTNTKLKAAIGIYRKLGFKEVRLDGQEYNRADTRMELLLKPQTAIKWFEKQFDFHFGMEQFPGLLKRLEKMPSELRETTSEISGDYLNFKPGGKWSIKEHIGHLYILELLWQKRFSEIKENKAGMSPADLNNRATDNALFNQYDIAKIIADFQQERKNTVQLLKSFSGDDFLNSLYHPRLQQPMRIIHLMFFVAEHDEHHLNAILEISKNLSRL